MVGDNMRVLVTAVSMIITFSTVPSGTAAAQTALVRGQVTIRERRGDQTEDLQNVVVYLEPVAASSRAGQPAPAPTNTVIALQDRQFSPRVRVVVEGSKIEFPNQDPFSHNVFSKMNGGFDTGTFGRGKVRDQVFREPGVYALYCNVHPRMTAFVITLKTPRYTQAGVDGRFVLDSVPPGYYKLHAWHDRTIEVVRDLTVSASGAANVRVELDARGYKYVQHKNKFGQGYTSSSGDRY